MRRTAHLLRGPAGAGWLTQGGHKGRPYKRERDAPATAGETPALRETFRFLRRAP